MHACRHNATRDSLVISKWQMVFQGMVAVPQVHGHLGYTLNHSWHHRAGVHQVGPVGSHAAGHVPPGPVRRAGGAADEFAEAQMGVHQDGSGASLRTAHQRHIQRLFGAACSFRQHSAGQSPPSFQHSSTNTGSEANQTSWGGSVQAACRLLQRGAGVSRVTQIHIPANTHDAPLPRLS